MKHIHRRTTTYTPTHMYVHTHPYTRTQTPTHTYIHLHTYTHTYTHVYTHTHVHTHTHMCTHVCTHTYTHTYVPPAYLCQRRQMGYLLQLHPLLKRQIPCPPTDTMTTHDNQLLFEYSHSTKQCHISIAATSV